MLVELRMYMYIYLNIWYMYRYDIHITILIEIRIIIYYVSLSLDNALWQRIWWNMAARGFERDLWQVQAVGRAKDGLDIWEQEVEEAIQAMSEPTQDGVFLELETQRYELGVGHARVSPFRTSHWLWIHQHQFLREFQGSSFRCGRWCEVRKLAITAPHELHHPRVGLQSSRRLVTLPVFVHLFWELNGGCMEVVFLP